MNSTFRQDFRRRQSKLDEEGQHLHSLGREGGEEGGKSASDNFVFVVGSLFVIFGEGFEDQLCLLAAH